MAAVENAINKAITSCRKSDNDPDHHFAGAGKMVEMRLGTYRLETNRPKSS